MELQIPIRILKQLKSPSSALLWQSWNTDDHTHDVDSKFLSDEELAALNKLVATEEAQKVDINRKLQYKLQT